MKAISSFLDKKNIKKRRTIDEGTVFFLFGAFMEKEYGRQGLLNVQPKTYSKHVLTLKTEKSIWANEIYLNRANIIVAINSEIGECELSEIKVSRS